MGEAQFELRGQVLGLTAPDSVVVTEWKQLDAPPARIVSLPLSAEGVLRGVVPCRNTGLFALFLPGVNLERPLWVVGRKGLQYTVDASSGAPTLSYPASIAPEMEALAAYRQLDSALHRMDAYYLGQLRSPNPSAAFRQQWQTHRQRNTAQVLAFLEAQQSSLATVLVIAELTRTGFYLDYETHNAPISKALEAVTARHNFPLADSLLQRAEYFAATAPGQPAPAFKLPSPSGEVVSLSDFHGRWLLVDFWAAWCEPCRRENPELRQLYAQYRPAGVEFVGLSLDRSEMAWKKAIAQDSLSWPQASDLKFWESAVVASYRLQGIPARVLIDPEGRIYAKPTTVGELGQLLAELFPAASAAATDTTTAAILP